MGNLNNSAVLEWASGEAANGALVPPLLVLLRYLPLRLPVFLSFLKLKFFRHWLFSYILYGKCCTCSEVEVDLCVNVLLFYVFAKCEGLCALCGGTATSFWTLCFAAALCGSGRPLDHPQNSSLLCLLLMYHRAVSDRKNSTFQRNSSLTKWFPSMIHALSCI